MRSKIITTAVTGIILTLLTPAQGIIGYKCGSDLPNVTTVSLLEVSPCNVDAVEPVSHTVYIQLLQDSDYFISTVRLCKIKIHQQITYCGMHSHSSIVQGGSKSFVKPLTRENCDDVINFGQIKYGNALINDIIINSTNRRTLTVAGNVDPQGNCEGTTFLSDGTEYKNVVVTANFEITISEISASVNREKNELILPSGTRCAYHSGKCVDAEENYAFWDVISNSICNFNKYIILFEGLGVKVTDNTSSTPNVYFGNSSKEITFGLTQVGEATLCGYKIIETEHPKLFIFEVTPGIRPFATRKHLEIADISLTAYFNTKISYLAKHIKSQFNSLYKDIVFHRCNLEKQVIANSLHLAYTAPDQFALAIMKTEGYMAVPGGEVAHIIRCEPITCQPRRSEFCYLEFPVICKNKTYFLKPITKILIHHGTKRECNVLLPTMFSTKGGWRQLTPAPAEANAPQTLHPLKAPTWKYQDVNDFVESGIYTEQDLERLKEHAMFPAEKPALLESLAQKLSGREHTQSIHFKNLLDQEAIEQLAESKLSQLWNGFMQFGTASSGILMIIVIIQLIKWIIDTMIHGYSLHTIYGWSIHLLGAIFSSITNLLVTLSKPKPSSIKIHGKYQTASSEERKESSFKRQTPTTKTLPAARPKRTIEDLEMQLLQGK